MRQTEQNSARQSERVQSVALCPCSAQELASALADAARSSHLISLDGAGSKRLMSGPCLPADITVSTSGLNRILQYEPHDLTVSVEAGMRWADLQALLAREGQMVAIDPPFADQATVGGVVASNSSGPLRKLFGTARDLVIGMHFATLEGKLIRAGGMVVKNVAGLDLGKLLIGSFGTLAAITSVNFRLHLLPERTETFLFSLPDVETAMARRDAILSSSLRPLALELLSPATAKRFGRSQYVLAFRAGGSERLLARYRHELAEGEHLSENCEEQFWAQVRELTKEILQTNPESIVLRVSTSLGEIGKVLRITSGLGISRAGTGVTYLYFDSWDATRVIWNAASQEGWAAAVEFAPAEIRATQPLWLPGSQEAEAGFTMMKNVKKLFDDGNLLNRSRLYGRI